MTTPKMIIHDCITGETSTRDFNAAELEQWEIDKAQNLKDAAKNAKAEAAKAAARQIVLDKLGLTADEIATLLG